MSASHAPGPWTVSLDHIFRNQSDIFEIHWSSIGECVAECVHGEANARLIAAAPDLLYALSEIISEKAPTYHDCTDDGEPECCWCIARAAIAKATGVTT